jgi:rod shape-determining protein MreB
MDEAIIRYIKQKHNLLIGDRMAEQIKIGVGSAFPPEGPLELEVRGRNLIQGVPQAITITDTEIREALSECIGVIVNAVRTALEKVPPELSGDLVDRGIMLVGGGALLRNLDRKLADETQLPVMLAEDPLRSVVMGTGKLLTDFKFLRKVALDVD